MYGTISAPVWHEGLECQRIVSKEIKMNTKTTTLSSYLHRGKLTSLPTSTKWLGAELILISLVIAALNVAGHPLLWSYQWHKLLHIFGAVIFLGNILVTAVWLAMAEQSKTQATLHFATKLVNWADVFFTAPGVLLTLANGHILATAAWGGLTTSWIMVAFGLFILSGLVWVGFLLRYQNRLIQLSAQPAVSGEPLPDAFFQTLHHWYIAGMVATLLPLVSMMLMVFKPQLW
jgi:uncharacterized membrane protein